MTWMTYSAPTGELRVYVLGIALHALSLNATIVTVAVIDSAVFDSLFREAAHVNAEGEIVVRWEGDKERNSLSFDEATVSRFLHTEQLMSSSAITGLSLAWRHRTDILVRQPEIEMFTVVSLFVVGSGWFWPGAGGVVARLTSVDGARGCWLGGRSGC
jgi:hypothetical protein